MQEQQPFLAEGSVSKKAESFDQKITSIRQQREQIEKFFAEARASIDKLVERRTEKITIIQDCRTKIEELASKDPTLKEKIKEELQKQQAECEKISVEIYRIRKGMRQAERKKIELNEKLDQRKGQKREIESQYQANAKGSISILDNDPDELQTMLKKHYKRCIDEHNDINSEQEKLTIELGIIKQQITVHREEIATVWKQEQELLNQQSARQHQIIDDSKQYDNEPEPSIIKKINSELDIMDTAIQEHANLQQRLTRKLNALKRKHEEGEALKRQLEGLAADDNDAINEDQVVLLTPEEILAQEGIILPSAKPVTSEQTMAQMSELVRKKLIQTGTLRIIPPEAEGVKTVTFAQKVINAARERPGLVKEIDLNNLTVLGHPEVLENLVSLFKDKECRLRRVSLAYIGLTGSQLVPLLEALADKPLVYLNLAGNDIGQDGKDSSRSQSSRRPRRKHNGMRTLVVLVQEAFQKTGKQLELILDDNKLSDRAMEVFCDGLKSYGILPKLSLLDTDISNASLSLLLETAKICEKSNECFAVKLPKLTFNDDNVQKLVALSFKKFRYDLQCCSFDGAQTCRLLTHMADFSGEEYELYAYSAISISEENFDIFKRAINNSRTLAFAASLDELSHEQRQAALDKIKKAKHIMFPGFTNLPIKDDDFNVLCEIFKRPNLSAISIRLHYYEYAGPLNIDELIKIWCKNPQFINLQFIDVFGHNCLLTIEAFERLANTRSRTKQLSLVGFNITDEHLKNHVTTLAKNYPNLTALFLDNNQISQLGLIELLVAFEGHEHLTIIQVGNNNPLYPEDASTICDSISNRRLLNALVKRPEGAHVDDKNTRLTEFQRALSEEIKGRRRRHSEPAPFPYLKRAHHSHFKPSNLLSYKSGALNALDLADDIEFKRKKQPTYFSHITELDLSGNPELLSGNSSEQITTNYATLANILLSFQSLKRLHLDDVDLKDQYIGPLITAIRQLPYLEEITLENNRGLSQVNVRNFNPFQ